MTRWNREALQRNRNQNLILFSKVTLQYLSQTKTWKILQTDSAQELILIARATLNSKPLPIKMDSLVYITYQWVSLSPLPMRLITSYNESLMKSIIWEEAQRQTLNFIMMIQLKLKNAFANLSLMGLNLKRMIHSFKIITAIKWAVLKTGTEIKVEVELSTIHIVRWGYNKEVLEDIPRMKIHSS